MNQTQRKTFIRLRKELKKLIEGVKISFKLIDNIDAIVAINWEEDCEPWVRVENFKPNQQIMRGGHVLSAHEKLSLREEKKILDYICEAMSYNDDNFLLEEIVFKKAAVKMATEKFQKRITKWNKDCNNLSLELGKKKYYVSDKLIDEGWPR
jgi:hypothetical protein